MLGWMKHKLEIKTAGRNINNLRCRWHHPYGRKWRRTKEPLEESERGEWKNWLKTQHLENEDHGILSHHFMANRWGNNVNSDRLYFLGIQSHEMKRCLLLGRKAVTNLDSLLKSRDITLLINICLVKTMVFPVVMYGSESWTIQKAEHLRIDAFELWCGEDSWESLGLQGDPISPS